MTPIENCTDQNGPTCPALWWPGLGNGFLGSIAQSPTIRIAGYLSGDYGRYSASHSIPPIPSEGFSNKEYAYRARIPAYASSIIISGAALSAGTSRVALHLREGVYLERTSLLNGGEVELKTYFHQTRRNLIVVEAKLDCTRCTTDTELSLTAFSGQAAEDILFQTKAAGGLATRSVGASPRQLLGVLRAPEINGPSTAHLYTTNHTLGYIHDVCPSILAASVGGTRTVQLLSVLTLSLEVSSSTPAATDDVVARARRIYDDAKATNPATLLAEHKRGWAALWDSGGIELATDDFELQQTTNATLYYLYMSTRPDWLHSTLVPSTIAAAAPAHHGYYGTTFWDQDTFMAPPLMVFAPPIGENLLRNRLYQLPAYKINAKAFGLRGAYIPHEVGGTGGFARDNRINHIEVHVAADVALFAKQYYQLSRNASFLAEMYPLLEAIADYAVSRINRTDAEGWYSIETVEGTDEIPHDVNNDIFTNAVFVQAVEMAIEAAATLNRSLPRAVSSAWRDAAHRIKLNFFDDGILHREFDKYQRGDNVGQGDTVLLGFPLQFNASHRIWGGHMNETRLADIRYYGAHIDPRGSFMTAGHYVIAWLERPHRNLTSASKWFAKGRTRNYAPWRIWSEHAQNDGGAVNFLTAGGLFLQSLVFGYGGMRFADGGVSLDPVLPPSVRAMTLRGLNFAESEFDILIDQAGTHFAKRHGSAVVHRAANGIYWLTLPSKA